MQDCSCQTEDIHMRSTPTLFLLLLAGIGLAAEVPQVPKRPAFVEGKDYVVLERRRFNDQTRFDRPVEAFSLLFPKGWTVQAA